MNLGNRSRRVARKLREKGLRGVLGHLAYRLRRAARYFTEAEIIERRRRRVSVRVAAARGHMVQGGFFRGLKLAPHAYWAEGDVAAKVFGLYEQEVQREMARLQAERRRPLFVDVGGADGYFAVGAVVSGAFDHCVVFERSPRGRETILRHVALNDATGRVTILGEAAETSFVAEIGRASGCAPEDMVILCDIEGGEFALFSDGVLEALRRAAIIIEIHDFDATQADARNALRARAGKRFGVRTIRTGGRDLSGIPDVAALSDLDRALLVSEGRAALGEWWVLTPR